jgi:hypothetical protein
MTCTIHNLTRRIVSMRGNSGQSIHLPPGISIDVLDAEILNNAKVAKLEGIGAIAVHRERRVERTARTPARGKRAGS